MYAEYVDDKEIYDYYCTCRPGSVQGLPDSNAPCPTTFARASTFRFLGGLGGAQSLVWHQSCREFEQVPPAGLLRGSWPEFMPA